MSENAAIPLLRQCYRLAFGASLEPGFARYMHKGGASGAGAVLGYARADDAPLYLERYLDAPVEILAGLVLGRKVRRASIVEIGNFAACSAMAMVELWGNAANDLGGNSEVAAATLTAPLRAMFRRIGIPLFEIGVADPTRMGADLGSWGSYYQADPRVCIGVIADGQAAIAAFLARRERKIAA